MNQSLPPNRDASQPRPDAHARAGAKTILIVDDDPDLRQMLVKALGRSYNVYSAVDGANALELLGGIAPPDLIVTDVMMPNLDGYMMVFRLKRYPALARVPVIFLTARGAALDVVQGINVGARHYMTKPFKIADLMERARKILG